MMMNKGRSAALFAVVGISGLMLGGLLWGNLFTLITHEFPGPGPGFNQAGVKLHIDSTVTLNTVQPERFVSGPLSFIPQLVTWYWSVTGQMWREADGSYSIFWSRHAGVLTTIGKNYIEGKLGNNAFTNNTAFGEYISLSTSASAPAANWMEVPTEISTNGLQRAIGAYTSTGDGVWTIVKQFTASGAHTDVQCTGINWGGTLNDHSLLWADTFTPVTLASGDKLTITATTTVS